MKSERDAWIKWINANGLTEVGDDPKRHDASTRQRFWREKSTGAPPAVKVAPLTSKRSAPAESEVQEPKQQKKKQKAEAKPPSPEAEALLAEKGELRADPPLLPRKFLPPFCDLHT